MIAYHGSPVLFDRFDAGKIGSVNDRGANGYGIYLTDHRGIAESYAAPKWKGPDYAKGFLYEVEVPDGEYLSCDWLCVDQPEPVRSVLLDGIDRLAGPRAGYWKFVINDAPQMTRYYSQIGRLLHFSRLNGTPLEPDLAACGYVGCKKWREDWGVWEFVVFDPSDLRILSVAEHERAN